MKCEPVVYRLCTKNKAVYRAVVETILLVDRGMDPQVAIVYAAFLCSVDREDIRRYWNRIIRTDAWAYLGDRCPGITV